jgi:hypothetical protein
MIRASRDKSPRVAGMRLVAPALPENVRIRAIAETNDFTTLSLWCLTPI